jgi:hypothetical protein
VHKNNVLCVANFVPEKKVNFESNFDFCKYQKTKDGQNQSTCMATFEIKDLEEQTNEEQKN